MAKYLDETGLAHLVEKIKNCGIVPVNFTFEKRSITLTAPTGMIDPEKDKIYFYRWVKTNSRYKGISADNKHSTRRKKRARWVGVRATDNSTLTNQEIGGFSLPLSKKVIQPFYSLEKEKFKILNPEALITAFGAYYTMLDTSKKVFTIKNGAYKISRNYASSPTLIAYARWGAAVVREDKRISDITPFKIGVFMQQVPDDLSMADIPICFTGCK